MSATLLNEYGGYTRQRSGDGVTAGGLGLRRRPRLRLVSVDRVQSATSITADRPTLIRPGSAGYPNFARLKSHTVDRRRRTGFNQHSEKSTANPDWL